MTGSILDADDLRALFAKAGVKPGDTVVAYCHTGQQATALTFLLGFGTPLFNPTSATGPRRRARTAPRCGATRRRCCGRSWALAMPALTLTVPLLMRSATSSAALRSLPYT